MVLCTLRPTPTDQTTNNTIIPSSNQIAELIGIPPTTYKRIAQKIQSQRDALESRTGIIVGNKSSRNCTAHQVFSQVLKRKGNTMKVDNTLKLKILSFICEHPHVIQSPIANDSLIVKDESNQKINAHSKAVTSDPNL